MDLMYFLLFFTIVICVSLMTNECEHLILPYTEQSTKQDEGGREYVIQLLLEYVRRSENTHINKLTISVALSAKGF